jgi:hypothetical protein
MSRKGSHDPEEPFLSKLPSKMPTLVRMPTSVLALKRTHTVEI